MGTITGLDQCKKVARDLLDPRGERWTPLDLLEYLNAGQREIVILRPDTHVTVEAIKLTAGRTRQSLPDSGLRLIKLTMNMGDDGSHPGRPITIIEQEELNALAPDWHSEDPAALEIEHYAYDGASPKTFYVYRKLLQPRFVEAHFSSCPRDVMIKGVNGGTDNTVITLDDIWQTALYDYMLMRAHAKDTDARDDQESDRAYRRFLARLGLKVQVDRAMDPNRNSPPRDAKRGGEDVRPAF
jgi:hypothetical protein